MKIPEISVGVMSGEEISFTLTGSYADDHGLVKITGNWKSKLSDERIILTNGRRNLGVEEGFILSPYNINECHFVLHGVTIGVNFHWQRNEDQVFMGNLKLIIENGRLTAINILTIEDYLISVISSEMSANSSPELLKAHAVISRSWLLAQIQKSKSLSEGKKKYETDFRSENEIVRWYDREDHRNYDVCADDHCQRYQGITRASTPSVVKAISETYGEVLTSRGVICDSRFYKCCGGVTELFENVWEPVKHPYLQKVVDSAKPPDNLDYNLEMNNAAEKWIKSNPDSFCNSSDKSVLSQVLNDYDQETKDFYRWKVAYTQREISELVRDRTGIDFGSIEELTPLERGTSGRIIRLKISGTRKEMIIGKELEIRKALSKTHLYSSCFIVEKELINGESGFVLYGAGWGHGVGLCQIGAAVMGSKGYSYKQILMHYFKETKLEKIY
jgi:SpoIID/LytB domain protein